MKNNINSTTHEGGPTDGAASLPPEVNEESEAAATASPLNDNPAGEHELNEHRESINPAMDVTPETDVGTTMIEASPLIRGTATKDETCSKTESVGRSTPEMRQWLSDSGEAYEFYLLHAVLHDPHWRAKMVAIQGLPDDFLREECTLVMGAVSSAEGILRDLNRSQPTPPSCEFLSGGELLPAKICSKDNHDRKFSFGSTQLGRFACERLIRSSSIKRPGQTRGIRLYHVGDVENPATDQEDYIRAVCPDYLFGETTKSAPTPQKQTINTAQP